MNIEYCETGLMNATRHCAGKGHWRKREKERPSPCITYSLKHVACWSFLAPKSQRGDQTHTVQFRGFHLPDPMRIRERVCEVSSTDTVFTITGYLLHVLQKRLHKASGRRTATTASAPPQRRRRARLRWTLRTWFECARCRCQYRRNGMQSMRSAHQSAPKFRMRNASCLLANTKQRGKHPRCGAAAAHIVDVP